LRFSHVNGTRDVNIHIQLWSRVQNCANKNSSTKSWHNAQLGLENHNIMHTNNCIKFQWNKDTMHNYAWCQAMLRHFTEISPSADLEMKCWQVYSNQKLTIRGPSLSQNKIQAENQDTITVHNMATNKYCKVLLKFSQQFWRWRVDKLSLLENDH
jgi:hypothetical protein